MNVLNLIFIIFINLLPNNVSFNNDEYNLSTTKLDYINQDSGG